MMEMESTFPNEKCAVEAKTMRFRDRLARAIVLSRLKMLENDRLVLIDEQGRHRFGDSARHQDISAEI